MALKREFNSVNTAIKELRRKQKEMKLTYGQYSKRGFYGKVDFWNMLMALPIDDINVPAAVQGYNLGVLGDNPDYHPSGILGTAENYKSTRMPWQRREKR